MSFDNKLFYKIRIVILLITLVILGCFLLKDNIREGLSSSTCLGAYIKFSSDMSECDLNKYHELCSQINKFSTCSSDKNSICTQAMANDGVVQLTPSPKSCNPLTLDGCKPGACTFKINPINSQNQIMSLTKESYCELLKNDSITLPGPATIKSYTILNNKGQLIQQNCPEVRI